MSARSPAERSRSSSSIMAACARHTDLIVIDEASMVDEEIGRDLASFGVPISRSTIRRSSANQGHRVLHRGQAGRDPHRGSQAGARQSITHMATTVREGGRSRSATTARSRVTAKFASVDRCAFDQVLVGRNFVRRANNSDMRKQRGLHGPVPVVGDKFVCMRNDHEKGLLNGSIWIVEGAEVALKPLDPLATSSDAIGLRLRPDDGGDAVSVVTHAKFFDGTKDEMPYRDQYQFSAFDFGQAITVHKAQGSQWDSLFLLDESPGAFTQTISAGFTPA